MLHLASLVAASEPFLPFLPATNRAVIYVYLNLFANNRAYGGELLRCNRSVFGRFLLFQSLVALGLY